MKISMMGTSIAARAFNAVDDAAKKHCCEDEDEHAQASSKRVRSMSDFR
ncbi:MAG: hypothetical protein WC054_09805 [Candidatus Nanopelagicales bacterium]